MPKPISQIVTSKAVTVLIGSDFRSLPLEGDGQLAQQGRLLVEALKKTPQDYDEICRIADVVTWIKVKSLGRVSLDDNERLRLDGELVDFGLANRIPQMLHEGWDINPYLAYVERVAANPDPTIAQQLAEFIHKGGLPLTADGRFHAWKRVDKDLMSFHYGAHGKVQYPVGETVVEHDPDENRTNLCSRGLHACSPKYLSWYYNSDETARELIVTVDPAEVLAISNGECKLRARSYFVHAEVPYGSSQQDYFGGKAVEERFVQAEKPEQVKDVAYWTSQGAQEGTQDGTDEREGSYDCRPHVTPPEIKGDEEKTVAYLQAYAINYDEAWNAGKADKPDLATLAKLDVAEDMGGFDTSFRPNAYAGDHHPDGGEASATDEDITTYNLAYLGETLKRYRDCEVYPEFPNDRIFQAGKTSGDKAARIDKLNGVVPAPEPADGTLWNAMAKGDDENTFVFGYVLGYVEAWTEESLGIEP